MKRALYCTAIITALLAAAPSAQATSMFEPNINALSVNPEDGAIGPRVGFLEGLAISYQARELASSQYSIECALHQVEQEQINALKGAGAENIPMLPLRPLNLAHFYEDGGNETQINQIIAYDGRIGELQHQYVAMTRAKHLLWLAIPNSA
jgi:hypothetical protein